MHHGVKNGMLMFLFALLLLPGLQQLFPMVNSGCLYGFAADAPDVSFSTEAWWKSDYQLKKSNYLNDHLGFRADLIRLNNQIDYSLFRRLHSWKVVEGAGHFLFMDTYINDYYGRDYMGYDSIAQKLTKVKALQDTLARLGKTLILIHAPAKEYMYPEYIPGNFRLPPKSTTNLETYNHIGDSLGLNQIDFNTWFCALKNTSKENLYPRQGVHWSVYGSFLAADSLIRRIEQIRRIKMPHPVWTEVEHTETARASDDDIARTLNLIYPITRETFAYPRVSYTLPKGATRPRMIFLGDSFLPIWISDGIMDNTASDWQVWQWFSILWSPESRDGHKSVRDSDWIGALDQADCLVIMYTSFNLPVLGNGFVEAAYEHYFPGSVTKK